MRSVHARARGAQNLRCPRARDLLNHHSLLRPLACDLADQRLILLLLSSLLLPAIFGLVFLKLHHIESRLQVEACWAKR